MYQDLNNQNNQPLLFPENNNQPPQANPVNNPFINNQVNPRLQIRNAPGIGMNVLRSTNTQLVCPYCKSTITTSIKKTCSCPSVCCAIWLTPISWFTFQLIRQKDYNCFDAIHTCPNCKKTLGKYDAC